MGVCYKAVNPITKKWFGAPDNFSDKSFSMGNPINPFSSLFMHQIMYDSNDWKIVCDTDDLYYDSEDEDWENITQELYSKWKKFHCIDELNEPLLIKSGGSDLTCFETLLKNLK